MLVYMDRIEVVFAYRLIVERLNDSFATLPRHKHHLDHHKGLGLDDTAALHLPTNRCHGALDVGRRGPRRKVLRHDAERPSQPADRNALCWRGGTHVDLLLHDGVDFHSVEGGGSAGSGGLLLVGSLGGGGSTRSGDTGAQGALFVAIDTAVKIVRPFAVDIARGYLILWLRGPRAE